MVPLIPTQQAFVDQLEAKVRREKTIEQKYKPHPDEGAKGGPRLTREEGAPGVAHPEAEYVPFTQSELPPPRGENGNVQETREDELLNPHLISLTEHADEIVAQRALHDESMRALEEWSRMEVQSLREEVSRLQGELVTRDNSATLAGANPPSLATTAPSPLSTPSSQLRESALKPLTDSETRLTSFEVEPKGVRLILPSLHSFLAVRNAKAHQIITMSQDEWDEVLRRGVLERPAVAEARRLLQLQVQHRRQAIEGR